MRIELIETMLRKQHELNVETNGKNYRRGITNKNKSINWYRCIYMELSELIDSTPWKHWKNIDSEPDMENIKTELIDIWHFILSAYLEITNVDVASEIIYESTNKLATVRVLEAIKRTRYVSEIEAIVKEAENIMMDALECSKELSDRNVCSKDIEVSLKLEVLMKITKGFFRLAELIGIEDDTIYKIYVSKNTLNKFRQDNGYKEGMYEKIINGKEDNVWMLKMLDENPIITPEELYEKYDLFYKENK